MTASKWRHFSVEELACPCCGELRMDDEFMRMISHLRMILKFPFPVTSGYRCPEHNRAVGGAPDSPHLRGRAVDINVWGERAYRLVGEAQDFGISGIGVSQKGDYSSRFIHLDDLEGPTRPWIWSY